MTRRWSETGRGPPGGWGSGPVSRQPCDQVQDAEASLHHQGLLLCANAHIHPLNPEQNLRLGPSSPAHVLTLLPVNTSFSPSFWVQLVPPTSCGTPDWFQPVGCVYICTGRVLSGCRCDLGVFKACKHLDRSGSGVMQWDLWDQWDQVQMLLVPHTQ